MKPEHRIGRWIRRAALGAETVGVAAALLMLLFTVVDVVGSKVFGRPLRGSTELVGFAQVVAISAGLAMSFQSGRQITIEFLVARLPRLLRRAVQVPVSVVSLGLVGLLAWEALRYGAALAASGQVSSTAGLPFYPFAYALGAFAGVCALYFAWESWIAARGEVGADHEPR
ncbi:MAG TPA: TRAP transporter small permease [Bacillota bacterium]